MLRTPRLQSARPEGCMSESSQRRTDTGAEDWAGAMGEKWLEHLDSFEGMLAPIGRALIEHADFKAGQSVVDVGCGGGATSLEIARRVAAQGAVVGIDISPVLVAAAERRAVAAGARNLEFVCADAATASLGGRV